MNLTTLKNLWRRLYNKLLELNFYSDPSDDARTTQKGRIATRLYIIIFFCSIIVLTFYSSLRYSTETISVSEPSLLDYLLLEKSISERLTCPCTNIAVTQSSFISFSSKLHQLCSSDFLSDNWFNYLTYVQEVSFYGKSSWNWGALPKFRFLQAMCQLAQNTVNEAINQFGRSKFVTSVALTPDDFASQTSVIINNLMQGLLYNIHRKYFFFFYSFRYCCSIYSCN